MATPNIQQDLDSLILTIASTLQLLRQYEYALSTSVPPSAPTIASPNDAADRVLEDDPLSILHDSATIAVAGVAKVALLVLNPPFTPSAISFILRDLSSTTIPAMVSAVELIYPEKWTLIFHNEVKTRVSRLLSELRILLGEIPQDFQHAAFLSDKGFKSASLVWEACNALIGIREKGLAGVIVEMAKQHQSLLEDARQELDAWKKEGDEPPSPPLSDDGMQDIDPDDFDGLFTAANKYSSADATLRELFLQTLKHLTQVKLLYRGIIKRRLRQLPSPFHPESSQPSSFRLDSLMQNLAAIPTETDELATAFYDLDQEAVKLSLRRCKDLTLGAVGMAMLDWHEQGDSFSLWLQKWVSVSVVEQDLAGNGA